MNDIRQQPVGGMPLGIDNNRIARSRVGRALSQHMLRRSGGLQVAPVTERRGTKTSPGHPLAQPIANTKDTLQDTNRPNSSLAVESRGQAKGKPEPQM